MSFGATVPAGPADSRGVEEWAATLDQTSALLRDAHFDEARTRLERLKRSMLERIGPGEPADRLFAIVLGQLAVAQAGSGRRDEAIWSWHIAQNIFPAVRDVDLSGYGAAGEILTNNILPARPEKCPPKRASPPTLRKRVEPDYPEGARQFRSSGIVIVQVRLEDDGRLSEPHVLTAIAAPITYAALDALRRWRFEPLPAEDPLKDVPFCVTFNFRLR